MRKLTITTAALALCAACASTGGIAEDDTVKAGALGAAAGAVAGEVLADDPLTGAAIGGAAGAGGEALSDDDDEYDPYEDDDSLF